MESRLLYINGTYLQVFGDGTIVRKASQIPNRWGGFSPRPQKKLSPTKKKHGYMQVTVGNKSCRVHRIVAEAFFGPCPKGFVIDHIDGNPANNHKDNLRYLTHSDNTACYHKPRRGRKTIKTSRYRGVCWDAIRRKWKTSIKVNGKSIHGGYWDDETDAALSYDQLARENGRPMESLNTEYPF